MGFVDPIFLYLKTQAYQVYLKLFTLTIFTI